jgi:tetratricopeptide (TPR) repeat protein
MSFHRIIFALFIIPLVLLAQDIDEAIRLFNSFQYDRAREIFGEVTKKKDNPRVSEAYYYLGRLSLNPDSALKYYNIVRIDHPQSRYADIAHLEIAKLNIAREDYKEAIGVLNKLLEKYPESGVKDETLFWLGISHISLGEKAEGIKFLNTLKTDYPQSVWSERADNIIPNGEVKSEYFTIQVGSYSNKENAQELADRLKTKGHNARVVKALVKGNIYYRVWVGQFYTVEQAKNFLPVLDSLGLKGNVVKGF